MFAPDLINTLRGKSAEELVEWLKTGAINLDTPIQRGYVWDVKKRGLLINSILTSVPTGSIWFNKTSAGVYEALDGKQRLDTVRAYMNNEFAIWAGVEPKSISVNGEDLPIIGKLFRQLDKELQRKIKGHIFDIYWLNNATNEEKKIIFSRINSGVPIKPADLNRIDILSRAAFTSLAKHPILGLWLGDRKVRKFVDEDVLQDVFCMLCAPKPNLMSKPRSEFLKTTALTAGQEDELRSALDCLKAFHAGVSLNIPLFSKLRAKVHTEALVYAAVLAVRRGMTREGYVRRMKKFFSGAEHIVSVSEPYNTACRSGSSKEPQVRARMDAITRALDVSDSDIGGIGVESEVVKGKPRGRKAKPKTDAVIGAASARPPVKRGRGAGRPANAAE
ncbi:MAG: DUF262 domain-containing protein [Oscillospiraceae bacterium]|jgi:hypothetical protein|nr:DUF262 domain-containing protein [Oscillospiraceae bacterium]